MTSAPPVGMAEAPLRYGAVALLVLGVVMLIAMGAVQLDVGPAETMVWVVVAAAFALATRRAPRRTLALLAATCATVPYLESWFGLGKQMPLLLALAAAAGG